MSTTSFIYDTYIATTPETLWKALTCGEYTKKYFFESDIQSEWKVGASVQYLRDGKVTDYGTITTYEPYKTLSYTWTYVKDKSDQRVEPTQVTFHFRQLGDIVKLRIIHENLLQSDFVEKDDTFEGFNNGWPAIMSNLKTLLETGKILPPILP